MINPSMNPVIKVLLIDDHAVVRAGFRQLLAASGAIEVVAEAARGETAFQLYQDYRPDVTVLDLSMPGIGGLETLRRLVNRDADANVLVFSVHDEAVYVQRAVDAGARGYICKSSAPDLLVAAIKKLAAGGSYIEPGLLTGSPTSDADSQHAVIDRLSPREFDIFRLLAKGLTAHQIAAELRLSYKTVANYGTQIKSKLHVSSVAELAHIAMALGIMEK